MENDTPNPTAPRLSTESSVTEEVPESTHLFEKTPEHPVVPVQQPQPADITHLARTSLIETAVRFLENPRVQTRPLAERRAFLLKKGLTNEEADAAIAQARVTPAAVIQDAVVPGTMLSAPMPMLPYGPPPPEPSIWAYLRQASSSVVLLGVACYGAYYVYKRYLEPYLKGWEGGKPEPDRLAQVQAQMESLTSAIQQLKEAVSSMETALASDTRTQLKTLDGGKRDGTLSELKSEVLSVKALLLSRNQFPSTPKVTPMSPSIPSWQLSSDADCKKENGTANQLSDSEEDPEESKQQSKGAAAVTENGEVTENIAAIGHDCA